MLFSACSEDRGTTREVADANKDENVDPDQIRGYGEELTSAADMGTENEWRQHAEQTSNQMATDLKLSTDAQTRVQQALYERERRLAELHDEYNYTETNRMGGQAKNDTRNDMGNNPANDLDAERSNNQGNAYEGNSNVNDAENPNLSMRESDMNSERELIMADTDRDLKAALTPEQYKQYEQNRDKYKSMNAATGIKSNSGSSSTNTTGNNQSNMGTTNQNTNGDTNMNNSNQNKSGIGNKTNKN